MKFVRRYWVDALAIAVATVVFLVPFAVIFITAGKTRQDAAALDFTWPTEWRI